MFSRLPDDIIINIFSFIEIKDLYQVIPLVCKLWAKLCADNNLWRKLYCDKWGISDELAKGMLLTWRRCYVTKLKSIETNISMKQKNKRKEEKEEKPVICIKKKEPEIRPRSFRKSIILGEGARIILLGDMATGKSSILSRVHADVFDKTSPTSGVSFITKNISSENRLIKVILYDTAGNEKYRNILTSYYRNVHVIVLVYDITSLKSFETVKYWREQFKKQNHEAIIVLMGNKLDDDANRKITFSDAVEYQRTAEIELFFEVSAKTGQNIQEAFMHICAALLAHSLDDH